MASTFRPDLSAADPAPVSGFGPHIEELQEFFKSRGVSFGSARDLVPFVERLRTDVSFRDETASMVRAVIYRERDGLSRLELVELVTRAVGGAQADDANAPEIREAVRQVMAFIEGVFRMRWNPGAASASNEAETHAPAMPPESEPAESAPLENTEAAGAPQGMTDLFYRAQVVAGAEPAKAVAAERPASEATWVGEAKPATEAKPVNDVKPATERIVLSALETELLNTRASAPVSVPLFAQSEARPGASRFWLWAGAACALILAFCAGMLVHQRLLIPLRDPNQPYEAAPADDESTATAPAQTAVTARTPVAPSTNASPSINTRNSVVSTRARAAASRAAAGPASPARSAGNRVPLSAGEDAHLLPGYMAPAMIGASPALMASHLIDAPPVDYPALARMTHIEGKVLVEAVVGKNGQVIRAEAISGHHLLRGAAVREVYERRYRPYMLNDRPTDVATIVTVNFQLTER